MKIIKTLTVAMLLILILGAALLIVVKKYDESDFFIFEYSKQNISYERLKKSPVADSLPFEHLPVDAKYNVTYVSGRDYVLIISFYMAEHNMNKFMDDISDAWGKYYKFTASWMNGKDSPWGYRVPVTVYDTEIEQLSKFPDYFVYPNKNVGMSFWFVIPSLNKVIFYTHTT